MPAITGYYTLTEAAEVLQKSVAQVSRYIKAGLLPATDLGHQKLIEQAAVHKFSPPLRGNPNFRRDEKHC